MADEKSAPKKKKFIPPTPEELSPLFPTYEITDFIAAGGMGAVYKARQISLDRPVAIKILPREFGEDRQFRDSFEAEAKAMARLNHPNLMSVYDFGEANGMLFIAMEFVRGKALYYSAHRKQIDPVTAFKMIANIARGVAHAHDNGILHRDLKPANILLLPDTTPKVGDFGLARSVDNRGHRERTTFGTPGYTAPEVYSKKFAVDQRSDIFSLGAMLTELLSGELPKPNSSFMVSGIDPRFDAITRKATHPVPHERYASTHDFIREVEALLPQLDKNASGARTASLLNTGQITTRVAVHVTGPLTVAGTGALTGAVTGPMTAPVTAPVTGQLVTGQITGPIGGRRTQHPSLSPQEEKGKVSYVLLLIGLLAVGAVVYLVNGGGKDGTPFSTLTAMFDREDEAPASPVDRPSAANDTAQPSSQVTYPDGSASPELSRKAIADIRSKLRKAHLLSFNRFLRRENKIKSQLYQNLAEVIENQDATTFPKIDAFQAQLDTAKQNNVFPPGLAADAPASVAKFLEDAQNDITRNIALYQGKFDQARTAYLEALTAAASSFEKAGKKEVAGTLLKEMERAAQDELHLRLIFTSQAPPLP